MRSIFSTTLLLILIATAMYVWISQVNPAFAGSTPSTATASSQPLSLPLTPFTAGSIAAEHVTLPTFVGDGVVFIDTADGTPQAPYLAFEDSKHSLEIKALVFLKNSQQPCQISVGEFPCAPNSADDTSATGVVSPVPSGTAVHVEGGVDDQGIVVQSMQALASTPAGMVRFSSPLGHTMLLSNSTSILPLQIFDDASCTLGVGCFGNGTKRLETTISYKDSTTTTQIVPGTLFIFGKSAIVLLSVTGSGAAGVANFLVGTH